MPGNRDPSVIVKIRRDQQQGQAPPLPSAPGQLAPPHPAVPAGKAAPTGIPKYQPPKAPINRGGVQLRRNAQGNIAPEWIGAPQTPIPGTSRLLRQAEPQMFHKDQSRQPPPIDDTATSSDAELQAQLVAQGGQEMGLPPGEGLEGLDFSSPDAFLKSTQTIHPTWRGTVGAFLGNPVVSAVTTGLGAGMGTTFATSMLLGPEIGVPLGAAVGITAGAYALMKGSQAFQESTIGKALGWLDIFRSGVERSAGVAAQLGAAGLAEAFPGAGGDVKQVGTLKEVATHLGDAWKAAQMTYAVTTPYGLANIFDPKKWGGEGTTFVDYDVPDAPAGMQALVEARRRIGGWGGTPPENPDYVIAEIQGRYGLPGMMRQLGSGFVADPLMSFGWMSTKAIGLGAKAFGNEELANVAAQMLTPHRIANWAPEWLNGVHETGIAPTIQAYRNYLTSAKVFRAGFSVANDLSRFERYIIGTKTVHLLETGEYKTPTWSKTNPLSWLTYQLSETPESAARESVYQFSNNAQAYLSSLDWNNPETPARAVQMINDWRAASTATTMPDQIPEGGHIPYTIEGRIYGRVLPVEAADELLATWNQTRDMAQGLNAIADSLGVTPKNVLDRLGDPDSAATLLRQAQATGAAGMEALTPEALDALYKVFTTDGVPLDNAMFHAAIVEKMMEQAGYWAVSTYGVKATGLITRFAAAVKSAESAALLGLNITYPVRNALNNEVMLAVAGAWGIRDIKGIVSDLNRAGLSPARLEQGFAGAADLPLDLADDFQHWGTSGVGEAMRPISKATKVGGKLEEFRDYVSNFTSKLPGTKAAQWAEKTQSARAYYSGFSEWMGQVWHRNNAVPPLPTDLEAALTKLDPRLPGAVLSAAESGLNVGEISQAVFDQAPTLNTHRFVGDVAARLNISETDVNRLLAVDGLGRWLDDELARVGPDARPEQLNPIFAAAKDKAENALNVLAAQEVATAAEHAAAVVQIEGPTAIMDLFGNVENSLYETYAAHTHALSLEWDELRRASPAIRDVLIGRMKTRSAQTWDRYFAYEHSVYDGISKGIASTGYDGFGATDFMKVIDAKRAEIQQFHTVKDQLNDRFFQTKFRNSATRDAAWQETQVRQGQVYDRLINRLETKQAKLDNYIVSWAKFHAGEEYAGRVAAWRSYTAKANFQDMRDVAAFRQSLISLEPSTRNAAWLSFQNSRLRMRYQIAQQGLDMLHGLGAAPVNPRAPLPVGGELKSGTWWQDVAQRYGLNYLKKDGTPHWQHFVRSVNKYLAEPIIGSKIRMSQAEIDGIPAPDRLGLIIDALETRQAEHDSMAADIANQQKPPSPLASTGDVAETPVTPPAAPTASRLPPPALPTSAAELPGAANVEWHLTRDVTASLNELGWSDSQIAAMPSNVATGYAAARTTPADVLAQTQAPEAGLRGVKRTPPIAPETPAPEIPEPPASAPIERRFDWARRANLEGQPPEVLNRIITYLRENAGQTGEVDPAHVSELTGFKTKGGWYDLKAIDPATGKPLKHPPLLPHLAGKVLVHGDITGLGYFNGRMGHAAGDVLLKTFGDLVKEQGIPEANVYHVSGDEFHFAFDSNQEAQQAMVRLKQSWADLQWSVEDENGVTYDLTQAGFDYGVGAGVGDDAAAERGLIDAKRTATETGWRPVVKGDKPPRMVEVARGAGGEAQAGQLAGASPEQVPAEVVPQPGIPGTPVPQAERAGIGTNGGHPGNIVPTELIGRYAFQGGETVAWETGVLSGAPRTLTAHVLRPQQAGETTVAIEMPDGGPAGELTVSRITAVKTNAAIDNLPLRPIPPADLVPSPETTGGAPVITPPETAMGSRIAENGGAAAQVPAAETLPPAASLPPTELPPPVRPDIQDARNATSAYMEMQQANANLVEPPTHLFDGTQYVLPGVPDDTLGVPRPLADGRDLWTLTLDERMALEKEYVHSYQAAMGRPVEGSFTPEMVKKIVQDHQDVLVNADVSAGMGYFPGDVVTSSIQWGKSKVYEDWTGTVKEYVPGKGMKPGHYVVDFPAKNSRHLAAATTLDVQPDNIELVTPAPGRSTPVPEAVWTSMIGNEKQFVRAYADRTSIPGEKIGKTLGRNGKKVTTPPAAIEPTIQSGTEAANGTQPTPAQATAPTTAEGTGRVAVGPGGGDQGPLAEVPAQDVRGPQAGGEVQPVGVRGPGIDGGRPGATGIEGDALRPGLGTGEGGVGAAAGRGAGAKAPLRPRSVSSPGRTGLDYLITPEDAVGAGGPKAKFRQNIEAIRTLHLIESEQRLATPAEQAVLVKYTGWGGNSESAFGYRDSAEWDGLRNQLRELLTDEEYTSAKASVNNSHYTSPVVLTGFWKAIRRLGWDGGRMLEPAAGIGHFYGMQPPDLAANTMRVGVEIDSLTARIARQLYQTADIRNTGFENTQFPKRFFDGTFSNVPFSKVGVYDPAFGRGQQALTAKLHDYYFAKALDLTRPGGIIGFITSTGTLDKLDPYVRQYISDRADLVGAIRLPNTAFKGNASTQVTTDLIFLKVREPGTPVGGETFTDLAEIPTSTKETPMKVNEYYARHPEMMLGHMEWTGSMYRDNTPTLEAFKGQELGAALDAAASNLPENVYGQQAPAARVPQAQLAPEQVAGIPGAREKSFQVQGGKVYRVENGQLVEPGGQVLPGKLVENRIKGLAGLRDTARELLDGQRNGTLDEAALTKLRARLNKQYDTFTKAYGNLHDTANVRAFSGDPDRNFTVALERYDVETGAVGKSTIFTKTTSTKPTPVTAVATAKDALVASLNEKGRLDLAHMSQLLGDKPPEEIGAELVQAGLAYHNPEGIWEPADQYLSGNVRAKLRAAEVAARIDPAYAPNVEALRPVQPVDIPYQDITAHLGAPWIKPTYIKEWIDQLLPTGYAWRKSQTQVLYMAGQGQWIAKLAEDAKGSVENLTTYGTPYRTAINLIQDLLDQKQTTVITTVDEINSALMQQIADLDVGGAARGMTPKAIERQRNALLKSISSETMAEDGRDLRKLNPFATAAAREMQAKIKANFDQWLYSDEPRAADLAATYNETFNSQRLRQFDGAHLSLPGVASEFQAGGDRALRPHQLNAIWRVVSSGQNTLLAHVVGAGKTYEMIGAAMELKRLGLANKSMFVVPNHLLGQWADEFMRMYPDANILVAGKEAFTDAARESLFTQIATNDYDAVIVPQSSFNKIDVSAETWNGYVQSQLNDLEDALIAARATANEAAGGKGRDMTVKALENAKKNLMKKLKAVKDIGTKDTMLTFEQLGVDQLFVDEAHAYKNLMYTTKMQRVKGLGTAQGSGRAFDMFVKSQYITKMNNGRGVTFATGTPISNSLIETYTMQRFMQLSRMQDLGIANLDAWAASFGDIRTEMGISADGQTYKPSTGMYAFNNVPELIQLFRDFADVQNAEDLHLPIPKLETGKAQAISVPSTPELQDYITALVDRADAIRSGQVRDPHVDNMLKIIGEGKKGALDMRLLDPNLPDSPNYKVNQAATRIYDIWKRTKADKSTQLVFMDMSTPKGAKIAAGETRPKFSVYDDLKAKLIKMGIPKDEVSFVHDWESDAKKVELFQKVNQGKIRVLMGSTEKMGAGMNVQSRLIAEHHLDAPWRPGDIEQRDGRILRPGNSNPEVAIYRYLTEGSFDAFMWDKIKTKAQFIARLMKGDITSRTAENTDAVTLSASEMSAVASGNPMVLEKYAADAEVAKFTSAEMAYRDRVRLLNRQMGDLPQKITNSQARVEAHQTAYSYFKAHKSEKFNATIGNKTYADYGDAGDRLAELLQEATAKANARGVPGRQRQPIGALDGFTLGIQADTTQGRPLGFTVDADGFKKANFENRTDILLYLQEPESKVTYFASPTQTAEGTARKLTRTLEDIPVTVAGLKDQVNTLTSDLAKVQAEAQQPFEYAAKLAAARAKQLEIDNALMPPTDQGADNGQLVTLDEEPAADGEGGTMPVNDTLNTLPSDIPPTTDPNGIGGGDKAQGAVYNLPGQGNFVIEGWEPRQGGYVIRRLDDNTVHVIGRQQEESATFVGAGQFDQAAGGAPMPRAAPSQEAWYGRLLPLLDEMQKRMEAEARAPALRGVNEAPPDVRQGVADWLQQVGGAQGEAKLGAMKWGEFRRDLAMLNYSRRYNFDTLLGNLMPYEFWMTHSLAKWALHTMDRPSLLANYYRIQKFLNSAVTRPGFPTRLAGKVRIPVPWMPDWMGGGLYVDPMMIGLPLEQFALPFQQAQDQQAQTESSAAYLIQDGVTQGTIPAAEGKQALATRAGAVWEQAMATAANQNGAEQQDMLDFANLMSSPHLPLSWALAYMRGKQNTISPLPLTRQIKAITAVAGLGPPGGFNLEAGARRALNLPIFDQWEDYRIDRTLADMAAEGIIDSKTAEATMIQRSGQIFEYATRRAALQSGMGTVTGFVMGTPGSVYPEGEHRQRDLSLLFKAARNAQDTGDTQALNNFFDAHPEYSARLALTDTPQGRLQNFLVDGVWEKWNALPDLYRHEVQNAFGDVFNNAFLSKETRSYASIPPETLAAWARTLGQYVPNNIAGAAIPVKFAPPQIAQMAQAYYDARDQMNYPMISALQKQYFAIPTTESVQLPVPAGVQAYLDHKDQAYPGVEDLYAFYNNIGTTKGRSAFMRDHPAMTAYNDYRAWWKRQNPDLAKYLDATDNYKGNSQSARSAFASQYPALTKYWDWRRAFLAANPEVGPYLSENAPAATTTTKATSEPTGIIADPGTQRVVTAYLFAGADLPGNMRARLKVAYNDQQPAGKTFDQWLLEIMAFGGSLEGPAAPQFNPPVAQAQAVPVQ